MRPLRYSINVTLDGCCHHEAGLPPDEEPGHFSLCGEGLCIGYDSADAVSSMYAGSSFAFANGQIAKVVFDIADDAYIDVEGHLAAAMARD